MTSREKEEASAWCMEKGPVLMVNGHVHPSWPRTENGIMTKMGPDPAGSEVERPRHQVSHFSSRRANGEGNPELTAELLHAPPAYLPLVTRGKPNFSCASTTVIQVSVTHNSG